jgi:hypothetical protein
MGKGTGKSLRLVRERSPNKGFTGYLARPRLAVTAVTMRYVLNMFEHAPQSHMMALPPGPFGVL